MKSLILVSSIALGALFVLALTVLQQSASAETNALKLIVQVDSVSVVLPNTEIEISLNMTNLSDSIASFAMKLRLDDNVHFAIDSISYDGSDSICFASVESFGTRIQNWEFLAATVAYDSTGEVLFVTGFSDDGAIPTMLPLSPGSGTFFRFVLELNSDFPLSLCNAQLSPLRLIDSATTFYNPAGELIGFNCTAIDSVDVTCILDSTEAMYLDGAISSWCCLWNDELYQCGDCDANGMISVSDAVCVISWIFAWPGPDTKPSCMRFANGDGMVSISDAVYLINYIFAGGPAPRCE